MSERAASADAAGVGASLLEGLSMLLFILLPLAGFIVVVAEPAARLVLEYGLMTPRGTLMVARVLAAFAIGLPAFSSFLVMTRAFYAVSDTRTPALINALTIVLTTIVGAAAFFLLSGPWRVPGLALGHSVGFMIGVLVLGGRLSRKLGEPILEKVRSPMAQSLVGAFLATSVMLGIHLAVPDASKPAAALDIISTALGGGVVYFVYMSRTGSAELARLMLLLPKRTSKA
jgi:putative peptidoglycan lipid II flippase